MHKYIKPSPTRAQPPSIVNGVLDTRLQKVIEHINLHCIKIDLYKAPGITRVGDYTYQVFYQNAFSKWLYKTLSNMIDASDNVRDGMIYCRELLKFTNDIKVRQ